MKDTPRKSAERVKKALKPAGARGPLPIKARREGCFYRFFLNASRIFSSSSGT